MIFPSSNNVISSTPITGWAQALIIWAQTSFIAAMKATLNGSLPTPASFGNSPLHRYYGESMPYGSQKEAYKNAFTLSYLTAGQALVDYALLITDLKRNLSAKVSPVRSFPTILTKIKQSHQTSTC
uniref:Uncharacterized protein n=1 Tax=Lactuca sativa TaxID=4236 RepID=A0A9R1UMG5_LACSA|nr:hypothetical protein LSAT_V11C800451240 [Lactuca sativa]